MLDPKANLDEQVQQNRRMNVEEFAEQAHKIDEKAQKMSTKIGHLVCANKKATQGQIDDEKEHRKRTEKGIASL